MNGRHGATAFVSLSFFSAIVIPSFFFVIWLLLILATATPVPQDRGVNEPLLSATSQN
jgi:hypothetical protein